LLDADLGGAELTGAELQGVDIYRALSLEKIKWVGTFLDRTRMRREQLGDAIGDEVEAHRTRTAEAYHEASEAYLLLKNNFSSIGRYHDAAWAYVKQQQMKKMAYFQEWTRKRPGTWQSPLHWFAFPAFRRRRWRNWFQSWRRWHWARRRAWSNLRRWLLSWTFELLTCYGDRPIRPILWAVAVIIAFAAGYAIAGNIAPDFAGDPATAQGSHNFVDALTHSIGAFATIGFNTLEPLGWGARLLTAIESAFGIGLFALFIFTLGNRMSRS
jgi:hypothetical protein